MQCAVKNMRSFADAEMRMMYAFKLIQERKKTVASGSAEQCFMLMAPLTCDIVGEVGRPAGRAVSGLTPLR